MYLDLFICFCLYLSLFMPMEYRIKQLANQQKEGTYKINYGRSVIELAVIYIMCLFGSFFMSKANFDAELVFVSGTVVFLSTIIFFNKMIVMFVGKPIIFISSFLVTLSYYLIYSLI